MSEPDVQRVLSQLIRLVNTDCAKGMGMKAATHVSFMTGTALRRLLDERMCVQSTKNRKHGVPQAAHQRAHGLRILEAYEEVKHRSRLSTAKV